jgi:hypothetical protein
MFDIENFDSGALEKTFRKGVGLVAENVPLYAPRDIANR